MQDSLIWPLVGIFDETGTDGICTNVLPFLAVAFAAPEPVMKTARLESRCILAGSMAKLPFPNAIQCSIVISPFLGAQNRWR